MNTTVKIGKPIFQPCFVLAPHYTIHPGSRILLQGFETLPQQTRRHMVQQSSEPLFLPFPRRSAHAAQSLGHPFPALCRFSAGLLDVLLGLPPSLHCLRRRFPLFVRLFHRYYSAVRLLPSVHVCIAGLRLHRPVCIFGRRTGGLPVLVHVVSRRARVFDHAVPRLDSRP
jgi:hypothetical protein